MLSELGQPRPGDGDAGIGQALVLAVERQGVGELVDQHSGNKAHVGAATFDDPDRRGRADDCLRVVALDDRANVFEDHVAARALRQAMADFLADHFVLLGR